MTEWRDARLQRALEDAPDREVLPDATTRQAVHDFAHKAVAAPVVASLPWWKKLGPDTGAARMPWNAALATVALATLVTVLWRDEPVPGAATQGSQADRAATTKVTPSVAPPSPPPAAVASAAPAPRPRIANDTKVAKRPAAEPALERRAETNVESLRDKQERSLSKATAPPAQVAEDRLGGAAAGASTGPARSDAVAESASPAPAAAAPRTFARPAAAPPAPALSAQTAAPVRAEWTHVRIESSGRSVEITRDQAATLLNLLGAIERAARTQPVLDVPPTTRIELRGQGAVLDVVELGGGRARWQNLRGSRNEMVAAQPSAEQLQAVQAEVDRLLGR
ncbi:MAG TPA: hypothetical protein VK996_14745 [Ramlibacter sp.]|nr:hypothetical protein [Ramlibacter sp.]